MNLSMQHREMYNTLNDVDNQGNVSPNVIYNNGQLEVNVPIKALNQNIDANGDQSLITRRYLTQKLDAVNSAAKVLEDSVKAAQRDIDVLYSNDSHVSVLPGQVLNTAANDTITIGTIAYKQFVSLQPSENSLGDTIEKPVFATTVKEFKLNLKPYAPVNSPTLTGTPQASETIDAGNHTQRLATTKFVHNLISASVMGSDSLPGNFKLNTLRKISTALGDDTIFKTNVTNSINKKVDFNTVMLAASDTVTTHTKIGSVSLGTGDSTSVKVANFYVDLTPYAKHTNPTLTGAKTKDTIAATSNDKTVANTAFVHTAVGNLQTALIDGATLTTFKALQDSINAAATAATSGIDTKQDKHSLLTALSNVNTIAKDKFLYTSAPNVFSVASVTDKGRTLIAFSDVASMRNHLGLPPVTNSIWQASVAGAINATRADSATTASKATDATRAGQDSLGAVINTTYQKVADLSTAVSKLAASVATYDSSNRKIVDTYQTKAADSIAVVTDTIAAPSSLPQRLYGKIVITNGSKSSVGQKTHTIVTGLHNATLTGTPMAPAYSETSTYYSKIATAQDIANLIEQATGVTVTVEGETPPGGGGGGGSTQQGGSNDHPPETVPAPASNGTPTTIVRDPDDPTHITIVSGNSSVPITTAGSGNETVNVTLPGTNATLNVTIPGSPNAEDVMTKITLVSAALDNDSLFAQNVRSSLNNKQDKTATLTGLLNNTVIKNSYAVTLPKDHFYYGKGKNSLGTSSISAVGRGILSQPTKDDVLRYLEIKPALPSGSGGDTLVTNQTIIGGNNTTLIVGGDISSVDYASVAGTAGFAQQASLDSAGHTITSWYIPKTDIYVYGNSGKLTSLTSAHPSMSGASDDLAWTASKGGTYKVLSLNDLAFWNGKYDGTHSNLQYFKIGSGTGALGTMASLTASDYFETSGAYNAAKYAVRDGAGHTISSYYAVASDVVSNVVLGGTSNSQLLVTRGGTTTSIRPADHSYKIVVGNSATATANAATTKGNNKTVYVNLVDAFAGTNAVVSSAKLNAPSGGNFSIEADATGIIKFYAPDLNNKVEQKKVTTNANYYILGTGTSVASDQTASANFSDKVYINANTGLLTAASVKAAQFIDTSGNNILASSSGVAFGVCTSKRTSATKTVNISTVTELTNGLHVTILFNPSQSGAQPTQAQLEQEVALTVNGTTNNVYYNGAKLTAQYFVSQCCYTFVFYDSKWYLCGSTFV